MNKPSRELVERLRKRYPAGSRIELISMDDPYREMLPRLKATVLAVDDMATVHIQWDNGSTLGAVHGVDQIREVSE